MEETGVVMRNKSSNKHLKEDVGMEHGGLDPPILFLPEESSVVFLALQADHEFIQFLLNGSHLPLAATLFHPVAAVADEVL